MRFPSASLVIIICSLFTSWRSANGEALSWGNTSVDSVATLDELTVTADRDFDIRGRTVVYPSISDVAASSTSTSLFQKLSLPALDVNPINRSLSVMGDSPVILINGVPSSINDLRSLSPKSIKKVEYSIMRPEQYRGDGGYGFISITLRPKDEGGQIFCYTRSAINAALVDGNFSGSYRRGPSEFRVLFSPEWRNNPDVTDLSELAYIGDDFRVDLQTFSRAPFNYLRLPGSLRYVYGPDQSTLFSATLNLDGGPEHRRSIGRTEDSVMGVYDFANEQTGRDVAGAVDLYFRKDFNSRNFLEAQCVGTLGSSEYVRQNTYFIGDSPMRYDVDISSNRQSLITEIAYTLVINSNTNFSAGFQNTLSHSSNSYKETDYNPVLTENNNYLYVSLSRQISRVYVNASTGLRMYWLRNDQSNRNFIRNVTSIQLQWTPIRRASIGGTFSYRSGIPSLSSLTDYVQKVSPYLYSNGNPDLKSVYLFAGRLQGTWHHKWVNVTGLFVYNSIHNMRYAEVSYLGNGQFLSRDANLKKTDVIGGQLDLKLNNFRGFGATATIRYAHYCSYMPSYKVSCAGWDGSFSLWYAYRKFVFSYWRKIPGKVLSGTTVSREENGDMLQVEYKPDSHWTIGASWMYMFDSKGARYPLSNYSDVNPSTMTRYIRNSGNMIVLNLTYQVDFGKILQSRKRSLNNRDTESAILKL